MKKILQICYRPPLPSKDGGTIVMSDLFKNLNDDNNNRVFQFIISTSKHPIEEEYYNRQKSFSSFINTSFQLKKILDYYPNAILTRFKHQTLIDDLKKYIEKVKPDIIIADGLYSLYITSLLKNKSIFDKVYYRAHNIEHLIWERKLNSSVNFLKKIILNPIIKKFKKEEAKLISLLKNPILYISKKDKEILKSNGVVVNFDVPKIETLVDKPPLKNIFFIGAMNWGPNIDGIKDFVSKEWDQIYNHDPELTFYIAGRNYEPTPELENKKGIKILGEINKLEEIYNKGQITIIPIWYGSGIKVKIIEALRAGKCIITTPLGVEGIDITHNKNIIVCNTNEEIKKSLFKLIKNPEKVESISKSAKKFADNFFNGDLIKLQLQKILK